MQPLSATRVIPASPGKNFSPIDVQALVKKTPFLPPAFELIPRLLLLLDDPEANCENLSEVIRIDAALTADVLQIANGGAFGGARTTNSLSEAIIRVGLREIYRLVMKIVTLPALTSQEAFEFQKVDLWRHSLATAIAAQTVARQKTCEDPELVFTAALLHDIGKVLLAHSTGPDYLYVLEGCAQSSRTVFCAERDAFRTDHLEAGGALLRAWRFPDRIVAAVAGHHTPTAVKKEHAPLASLIYAGNILAYRIGQGNGYPIYSIHPEPSALRIIDLEPDDLKSYEEEVLELVRREQQRFW